MKPTRLLALAVLASASLSACAGPVEDDGMASDAKPESADVAVEPVAEAPIADVLMALDRQASEAFLNGDSRFFEGLLTDNFVTRDGGPRMGKAAMLEMIGGLRCEAKSWGLDEQWIAQIDPDTYVSSYRGTWDGSCAGANGESIKIPSPVRAATIWVRNDGKWQAAFHEENRILDPKDLPAAPLEQPASSTADAQPADARTDALVKLETAIWDAWKDHDAKKIEEATADSLSFIDIFGNFDANRADTLEAWSGSICDIKSVSITDGVAYTISPTVELLTHRGAADGSCYGEKIGAVLGTSAYVKDGDAWKLAFTMNMPEK